MSGIVVENLVRRHGALRTLDEVSFSAEPGELVVLLGPSGCGKSTLLRLIAGLDLPDAGTIRLGGRDMTYAEPAERMVSMVFQSYGLFPHLTVADNILFGLQVRRTPKSEQAERLKRASATLGLEALLGRRPAQLSGGQQQRVALARAIVAGRPICLMDEPLSNLDAQLRGSVRREIADLQKRLGLTMVYVTHDQIEAMTLADRIVLLRSGKLMQEGSPRDLFERPANSFAASFIGSPAMNLIRLEAADVGPALVAVWPESAAMLERRMTVMLGMRPDSLLVDPQGPLTATVRAVEYVGGAFVVTCEIFGQEVLVHAPGADLPISEGATIAFRARPGSEHLFDVESGIRLN